MDVPVASSSCASALLLLGEIHFDDAFSLAQSICSYGYFGLAPNCWVPAQPHDPDDDAGVFERPLVFGTPHHEEWCAVIRVHQAGSSVSVRWVGGDRPGTDFHVDQLLSQVRRILRADWSPDGFWKLHPEAKKRGFGRTFRSPTLWEVSTS